jgi:acyl-homoserine-lactone acylase
MTALTLIAVLAVQLPAQDPEAALSERVEIVRTEYGVPHILADDFEAMGFALGWVQSEDYGDQVAVGMVKARGTYARYVGPDSIGGDFTAREGHAIAVATFHQLSADTRDVYRGFAEGVNEYIRRHPEQFPDWLEPDFTGIDAHANDVQTWSRSDAAAFVRSQRRRSAETVPSSWQTALDREAGFDPGRDGSNAWALDGSRTSSGKAILLRNPHLAWDAGYYEAHVRVAGVLDFYGDFRIGGAFGIIGGFNEHLGWATTNNSPRYSQVYALARHPELSTVPMLGGDPVPVEERSISADWVDATGRRGVETEVTRWTPYGPIIHETEDRFFILKDPRHGEFRRGEQFLRMMETTSLDAWLTVMRTRAHPSSNFTYADAAGNIALYYNARIPSLPHAVTGDTAALAVEPGDIWSELVPWESLPLYVNPPGGYVQQANDTPDYINLNVHLDRDTVAPNLPEPRLRLRSQLSLDLVHNAPVMTLEEVLALKHSPRMLAAERMLDELLAALTASDDRADLEEARAILAAWDRTAAAESRGGVLFARWLETYEEVADNLVFREDWTAERPLDTPVGVGAPGKAVAALRFTVEDMRAAGVPLDAAWGDVYRVIRGEVDEPVSGCDGTLGCFRTLSFSETEDGRLAANRGDAWILAVEFGDRPRGYSVLAYGQSRIEDSPHFDDQAAMFARQEYKSIAWDDAEIAARAIRRYRPGVDSMTGSEGRARNPSP